MHTSISISSHMFTYIIDMYVWFSVYWFSVYITSILVAAEIAKTNHILKVTFWVYCTRLAPFCRTFILEKHQRRLMHVSYCISSHNFTYIIHIFVYAILIPSLQFSLHLKSKWLKNYSKSLPERTKSVLLIFLVDSCSPQYREEIDPDFQTSQPSYRRSYGTAKMTHPRFYMTVMESEKRCVYFDHPYISGNASLHAVHGDS